MDYKIYYKSYSDKLKVDAILSIIEKISSPSGIWIIPQSSSYSSYKSAYEIKVYGGTFMLLSELYEKLSKVLCISELVYLKHRYTGKEIDLAKNAMIAKEI